MVTSTNFGILGFYYFAIMEPISKELVLVNDYGFTENEFFENDVNLFLLKMKRILYVLSVLPGSLLRVLDRN